MAVCRKIAGRSTKQRRALCKPGLRLLDVEPLHRIQRLEFGGFGVEFFGIFDLGFAMQHDQAIGHFDACNRRIGIEFERLGE